MAEIKTQRYVQSIRQFSCPNCGSGLELLNKRSRYVGCNACGTVMDVRSEAYEVIMQMNLPSAYKPFRFLQLGMEGVFEGETYRILGRTRWKSTYLEYWAEGAYNGWGHEFWIYDEWVLMNKDQQYFYLIEDESGFYISKSFLPKNPLVPKSNSLSFNLDTNDAKDNHDVIEAGNSQVLFFEGESTYQIHAGDAVTFYEYKKNNNSYIIETRFDKGGNATEIEFFEEIPISEENIRIAFDKDPIVHQINEEVFSKYIFTKKAFRYATLFSLALWLYAVFFSGKEIYSGSLTFAPATTHILRTDKLEQKMPYSFDSVSLVSSDKEIPINSEFIDLSEGYTEPIDGYDFKHTYITKYYTGKSIYRETAYHLILPQTSTLSLQPNTTYTIKNPDWLSKQINVWGKHFFWIKDKKVIGSESNTDQEAPEIQVSSNIGGNLSLAFAPDISMVDDSLLYSPPNNLITITESSWDTVGLFLLFIFMLSGLIFQRRIAEIFFGNKTVASVLEEMEKSKEKKK